MNKFIKVLAHTGLFGVYVFIFYFATSLLGTPWTNWLWTIVTGLVLLLNCFILYFFCSSNDKKEQKQMSVIGTLLEALTTISWTGKIMTIQNVDIGFILLPFFICLFFSGINKFILSFSFLFGTILLFVNNTEFSSWHSYVVFISLIIVHLLAIFSLGYKPWEDDDLKLNRWGLLIIPVCVVYLCFFGELQLQSDFLLISILIYILLGFAVSMTNNIMVYGLSPLIIIVYGLLFMIKWHPLYSWLIIALAAVYSALFFLTFKYYKSYIEGLVIYLMKEYTNLGEVYTNLNEDYTRLGENYNQLVGYYNEIVLNGNNGEHCGRRSDYDDRRGKGNGGEIRKGFFRGVGRWIAKLVTEDIPDIFY